MTAEMTRLRVDAEENRDRIIEAARELFAQRGLAVGMREIARRADVGPATLYRRFPTRQALIDTAFSAEMSACRRIVEDAAADPDPWRGFSSAVHRLIGLNARNRGFVDALITGEPSSAVVRHRQELLGMLRGVTRRAQDAGELRRDFVLSDLLLILSAGRGLHAERPDLLPAAAHRFASLAIDGLAAAPGR
ncbi:TetR/AcrR family transcriptional regulator [Leifsonia shinshuensis]|uniref:AcrR family transcriptional regulator n=1 Tax=Leifsonia shinshuensis TaxID=150026 RepID=A0A853CQS3_9MICO|nr:TetR/AcrR family transcriptional regulator [Leifsonia shinshuensis]NYJ22273.1 AcrR family transcriptional regulator [Leifsonia shinshuensis]